MRYLTKKETFQGLALFLLLIFVFDTLLHFLIIPWDQLTFVWISFKGDIDFTTIGWLNLIVRFFIYGLMVFSLPRFVKVSLPSLLIVIIPTIYLMIDSWWVFENYVFLYGYWSALLLVLGLLIWLIVKKIYQPKFLIIMAGLSLGLGLLIGLVYVDIMGWDWPYEFVYSFFQRLVYESLFIFLVYVGNRLHHIKE
jgi:hypothetical protein